MVRVRACVRVCVYVCLCTYVCIYVYVYTVKLMTYWFNSGGSTCTWGMSGEASPTGLLNLLFLLVKPTFGYFR